VTELIHYGGENVLVVRADASCYEGWWYEGAGIYRHVWLVKTSPTHVARDGVCFRSVVRAGSARCDVEVAIERELAGPIRCEVELIDEDGERVAKRVVNTRDGNASLSLDVSRPRLWSCETPHLYRLRTRLYRGKVLLDEMETHVGIRTLRWDAKRGFFLNGQRVKIKGTCNHRDHAGVGAALPDRLHEVRIAKLKEMGSNAFRCAHYPHAAELLEACDRMGMLVMCENRLAGTGEDFVSSLETMVRRDRNHPSVILWSIGNEEHSVQWAKAGERIGAALVKRIRKLDPTRAVTAAMHDRGLGEGFANVVDVHGWNYMKVGDLEAFHARRPGQPIVGSEESSTVTSRGVYADDRGRGYVSAYDVRVPGWGTTAEKWWTYFAERDWLAGGFVWTGFDYRGEPIPYRWPCTTSHFGLMDLCGFPKDLYHYYRSWWREEPHVHLFPHWNHEGMEGREIDVRCFSNAEEVELIVNGKTLGRNVMKRNSHLAWPVVYVPGWIEARAYARGREVGRMRRETTGLAAALQLEVDRATIRCDGHDLACVTVRAIDADGRAVPTAMDRVRFEIDGPGRLIGVGNGDPSSHEADKGSTRSLFNGLALAIVQGTREAGEIVVRAVAEGLIETSVRIRTR
jgi:beta-galactosidase